MFLESYNLTRNTNSRRPACFLPAYFHFIFKISGILSRDRLQKFETDFDKFSIVGVVCTRQVGKTSLVKNIQSILKSDWVYVDLDLQSDKAELANTEFT